MRRQALKLLVCDCKGKIYDFPNLEPAGMKSGIFFRLRQKDLIKLPLGSSVFLLPNRLAVGYDSNTQEFVKVTENPLFKKNKHCFAVAAFIQPGFTATYNSAYIEAGRTGILPLFAYSAVCMYKNEFYVTAVRVDKELRQDFRCIDTGLIAQGVKKVRKILPKNRLVRHLENCALIYNCPAAKNFFLSRYEAPLPTSPVCNADCIGCISYQPGKRCPVTQPRIKSIPRPEEISDVALFHIKNVKDPVVSFGQGCEGEPLLVGDVLERAIKLIKKNTSKGIINVNTNASKPKIIARLFDAGLDSIRVSLNSAQEKYYSRYYKPRRYKFIDVKNSIKIAKKKGGFVSINYLTMPGFSDSRREFSAFERFIKSHDIDMIQWRNMNYDPLAYFRDLGVSFDASELMGVKKIISSIRKSFPKIMMGYFNPSRARMRRCEFR